MYSCKQTSEKVSESMERKLGLFERFNCWLHLMMCGNCHRYAKNLEKLTQIFQLVGRHNHGLSAQKRNKLKKFLINQSECE